MTSLMLELNADADTNAQLDISFESEDLDWLEHCYFSEDSGDEYNEKNIPVKKRRIEIKSVSKLIKFPGLHQQLK
ncbi:hypothetical protein EB796_003650 [Bugula neritina]|uniref:Uncharacterized protein n=1 Tax=Bugula neritina TaxID=10212 RepID=A0A7J7KKB0_BUGNE|nr:hypothetical protein EB796_003650 [Bugula neritina]